MHIYSTPLTCTPRYGYCGKFMLCMFCHNLRRKDKPAAREQESRQQQHSSGRWHQTDGQLAGGRMPSHKPVLGTAEHRPGFHHRTLQKGRKPASGTRGGIHCMEGWGGLDERSCISTPTSPFLMLGACRLTPLLKFGDSLPGKCESGGRAPSR